MVANCRVPIGRVVFRAIALVVVFLLVASAPSWAGKNKKPKGKKHDSHAVKFVKDTTPPGDVTGFTSSRTLTNLRLDWTAPDDEDLAGVLVLANIRPVTLRPTDGKSYRPFVVIQRHLVLCVTGPHDNGCGVDLPAGLLPATGGYTFHFEAFAFDTSRNYSNGLKALSLAVDPADAAWSYWTQADAMAPPGVVPGLYVVGTGDDEFLHRVDTAEGLRSGWMPLEVGGRIEDRVMAGDLDVTGTAPDPTAFAGADDGVLYRFALDDGTAAPEAQRNVAGAGGDAGCAAGALRASPLVTLDAFDANPNDTDDAVIVGTRCGTTDNRVLLYSPDFATLHASYDGGIDGLGAIVAPPRIFYRDSADNMVYVPVLDDGGESLLALEIAPGPVFNVYAVVSGIGGATANPVPFWRGASTLLAVGTDDGGLYLYDAFAREGDAGSSLVQLDVLHEGADPVSGLAVGNRTQVGPGLYENWVVWTAGDTVRGVKVDSTGHFDATTLWARTLAAPLGNLVLRSAFVANDTVAFVGTADGLLLGLDATTGAEVRRWPVLAGARISEPTFDYGDGVTQGLAVSSEGGGIFWLPLTAEPSTIGIRAATRRTNVPAVTEEIANRLRRGMRPTGF